MQAPISLLLSIVKLVGLRQVYAVIRHGRTSFFLTYSDLAQEKVVTKLTTMMAFLTHLVVTSEPDLHPTTFLSVILSVFVTPCSGRPTCWTSAPRTLSINRSLPPSPPVTSLPL